MARGVKTIGRSELLRKLADLPEAARKEIGKAIKQGADEIVAAQKRIVPKKTGALAASIVASTGANVPKYASVGRAGTSGGGAGDPELTVVISAGNSNARHAHLVEFGVAPHINGGLFSGSQHPGTKAQPFFYPVYRSYKKRVKSRVSRATTKAAKAIAST